MARKRKQKRAHMGEQSNHMATSRTNIERGDTMMGAGAHGDRMSGSEGIEESTDITRPFSGQGNQDEGSENPEGTGSAENSKTDESASEKPLT